MKIGDTVSVIDDILSGKVIRIENERITFLNDHDFEETYLSHQLVVISDIHHTEEEHIPVKEVDINTSSNKQKRKKEKKILEVDLHIGHLVDFTKDLSNYQMLTIQLDKAREVIEQQLEIKQYKRIVFIHGHGDGVLRKELYHLLDRYALRLQYFDASFRKYKLGATEVELK